MDIFANTNGLEGLRLLAGCVGFAVTLYGLLHVEDGQYAFAAPVRVREIADRRMVMLGHLVIHLILGFQTVLVAGTPDSYPLATSAITGNVTLLITLLILIGLAVRAIGRWGDAEEMIGRQPFTPTTDERLTEAARLGRPMIHAAFNDLQYAMNAVDILSGSGSLTPEQVTQLDVAADHIQLAAQQIGHVQALVRGLGPFAEGEHLGVPGP